MLRKYLVLRKADGETDGGGGATETLAAGMAGLEKLLADEPAASGEPVKKKTPPAEPSGEAEPEGETNDLSQKGGEGTPPEETAEEKAELEAEAKTRGVTVEQHRADLKSEQERTDAITAKTGETLEQIYAREEKDGKETDLETAQPKTVKTFKQEEVESLIEKRVKNLKNENESLKRQLNERPAPVNGDALSNVTSMEKLDEIRTTAQTQVREVQRLTKQLGFAPGRVQKYFEDLIAENPAIAKRFKNADGELEFTPERMADALETAESHFQSQLDAVPQREAFLKNFDNAHGIAMKVHPWLEDDEDERTAQFRTLESSPLGRFAKSNTASWEYWLGLAAAGHVAMQKFAKQNGNGKTPVKLKLRSVMPGTGKAAATAGRATGFKAAKDKAVKSGDAKDAKLALEELLG